MRNDPYCYSFRFCCDPFFNEEREIEALKQYVKEAGIDDVSVFCNVEEINTGHMTFEEQKKYLSMVENVRQAVAPQKASVSINHWHSIMHADLGKKFLPAQHFRPMVDIDGRESALCVCPMDEVWQDYFCELYANYAKKTPNILWIEDDFRYHNHAPLHWGGCFCEKHMEEYARRAGHTMTREEFIRGILQPGEPHPYRKIWLDVCRETLVALCKKLEKSVHAVSPETRIGLMSSVPFIHAAEGRDWHGMLNGLAGEHVVPVNRIHLPCYSECAPREYLMRFNMVSMANRALIPKNTAVLPELENYPYSLLSKSRAFTRFQLLASLPLAPAGMTIDLFDLNGNGIVFSDGYQKMLREVKPFLNRVNASGVMAEQQCGVRVMLCECSSYTLHTGSGKNMEELYPQEVYFAAVFNAMGVPFTYCTDPKISGKVVAISGQYLRNLDKQQMEALFRDNFVILSGDAVLTLQDMGLQAIAGIEKAVVMKQDGGDYSYEQVCNGKIYHELANSRASAIISSTDCVDVTYSGETEVYTQLHDAFRRVRAKGHVVSQGSVLVYPFCNFETPDSIPPMQLNAVRRDLLQDILNGRLDAPMVKNSAYLQPYCTRKGSDLYVLLVNGSQDPVTEVTMLFGTTCVKKAQWLSSRCKTAEFSVEEGADEAAFPIKIAPLDAGLLHLTMEETERKSST